MDVAKREKLVKRLENHLRKTARQLVKFDTEEETLQFLIDSFRSQLRCDFVGIMIKKGSVIHPKVWSGGFISITQSFPLPVDSCSPNLLERSLTFEELDEHANCAFFRLLEQNQVTTWFTVPLKEDLNQLGFCAIGFKDSVPLLTEVNQLFDEFGKDVAVAMTLAQRKEAQKKKMVGLEWLNESFTLHTSIERIVEKIVDRAGKGTQATIACIYLYDEAENCFQFQPPSFGKMNKSKKIEIERNYALKDHFQFLETAGGHQLTVPLVVDLKTIGVLHVEEKREGSFTEDDLETLELLSNHVATILENARLYQNEKNHKQRLHDLLEYQQALVKETVERDHFEGITQTLSQLFRKSVLLFDRLMRPMAHEILERDGLDLETLAVQAQAESKQRASRNVPFSFIYEEHIPMTAWPINGGGHLLGYLIIQFTHEEIDDFYQLSIDLALNIYAIQFNKQKLVLDAREQVKDSFLNKLLVEKIEDQKSIIQYANLFHWDLFHSHRVSVLSINLAQKESNKVNLLEQQAMKSLLWENIKTRLSIYDEDILLSSKGDEYILIVPASKERGKPKVYWAKVYQNIQSWVEQEGIRARLLLGIGGKTETIHDYFSCYQQAVQVHNVVSHRFRDIGFALFDELGSYTLLHHLKNTPATSLFIDKHLQPLLQYSQGRSTDLFYTLRVYLNQNGSIKETSDELYIHRSSLLYRLEKIETLLDVDLNDSEHRFNLMMAFKLYDLFYTK
ncbi:helix-turn-helix domain-containing protein [Halalkalibacterium halodurans]|nr:helix-turn-helix domain-containing protein [Halalkalibacterium halodurans]MED4123972.1 helix-turn-helix domain-containing protein [Halalkalibacterium halodurans]